MWRFRDVLVADTTAERFMGTWKVQLVGCTIAIAIIATSGLLGGSGGGGVLTTLAILRLSTHGPPGMFRYLGPQSLGLLKLEF